MRFYFERPGPDAIKPTWGHGRYLDAWSIVHVLTGVLAGIVAIGFGLPLWQGLFAIFVIVTLYEAVEMALSIIENLENVVLDIVLAIFGAGVAYWFIDGWDVATLATAFISIGVLNLGLLYLGWRYHLQKLLKDNRETI